MRVEFTVPGDIASLSPNARLIPPQRARMVREWRTKTALAANAAGFHTQPRGRAVVSFLVRRGRPLDGQNCDGSLALKAIVDSLFLNDRQVTVRPACQETSSHFALFPEVKVMVETEERSATDA